MEYCYWSSSDNKNFFPRGNETKFEQLPPGIYSIVHSQIGPFFSQNKIQDLSELLKFKDSKTDDVVNEVKSFWTKKSLFKKHNFPFKRGILLYGPPGGGKSCAIKLIMEDIVNMGGIAIMFDSPSLFSQIMVAFREIQPETPIVVVMEDIDSLLETGETGIVNILDGHLTFENMIFIATTNYFNNLSDRIKNRPSRFDKRIFIGSPSAETRFEYLSNLINKSDFKNLPIEQWAKDTEGLTFAHLKELYLSIAFFGTEYSETLERLKNMMPEEDYEDYELILKSPKKTKWNLLPKQYVETKDYISDSDGESEEVTDV